MRFQYNNKNVRAILYTPRKDGIYLEDIGKKVKYGVDMGRITEILGNGVHLIQSGGQCQYDLTIKEGAWLVFPGCIAVQEDEEEPMVMSIFQFQDRYPEIPDIYYRLIDSIMASRPIDDCELEEPLGDRQCDVDGDECESCQ